MPSDHMRVAQQVLGILDAGAMTQTYKYALLIALIDEVAEGVGPDGTPPSWTTGSRLADRVLRMYWDQTRVLDDGGHARQSGQRGGLVDLAAKRRERIAGAGWLPYDRFAAADPDAEEELRHRGRRAIRSYAIPLLQRYGTGATAVDIPFLYESWSQGRVQHDGACGDRLDLMPGVPESLLATGPLLRRVIQQEWLAFVHDRNRGRVAEPVLERVLFGAGRVDLGTARLALIELAGPSCTYCDAIQPAPEVDHFLPWSLSRDDGLSNLMIACTPCNADKRAQLAGEVFLSVWARRLTDLGAQLSAAAHDIGWPDDASRTRSRGRALYRPHAEAQVPFWLGRQQPPTSMTATTALSLLSDSS